MKKILYLIILILFLPISFLFCSCETPTGDSSFMFRLNDDYVQFSENGEVWKNLAKKDELKNLIDKIYGWDNVDITYESILTINENPNLNAITANEWITLEPISDFEYNDIIDFVGWYTDNNCTQKFESGTINCDITFYAKFKLKDDYLAFLCFSDSMYPMIKTNDLIVSKAVDPATLEVGDVISYRERNSSATVTHKIMQISIDEENVVHITTTGINNVSYDSNGEPIRNSQGELVTFPDTPITGDQVIGKMYKVIHLKDATKFSDWMKFIDLDNQISNSGASNTNEAITESDNTLTANSTISIIKNCTMRSPNSTENLNATISYFSQVETDISLYTAIDTVSNTGVFTPTNWTAITSYYNEHIDALASTNIGNYIVLNNLTDADNFCTTIYNSNSEKFSGAYSSGNTLPPMSARQSYPIDIDMSIEVKLNTGGDNFDTLLGECMAYLAQSASSGPLVIKPNGVNELTLMSSIPNEQSSVAVNIIINASQHVG